MHYRQRLNQFSKSTEWEITENSLNWRDENGGACQIPYSAITDIRLRFEPTRAQQNRHALRIKAGREFQITNIEYNGLADFTDQSDEFCEFVLALHEKVRSKNFNVRYRSGSTPAAFFGNLIMIAFVAFALIFAFIFTISQAIYWLVALKAVIIAFYVPTLIKFVRVNRPATYDPANVPAELMPTQQEAERPDI